jgi:hypothetical protein
MTLHGQTSTGTLEELTWNCWVCHYQSSQRLLLVVALGYSTMHNYGFSLPLNPIIGVLLVTTALSYIHRVLQEGWSTSLTTIFANFQLRVTWFLQQLGFKCSPRGFYRHFGGVCGLGSQGVHGQAIDFFSGSRAILQGYSASHYTFLVYRQPYITACEPIVHPVVFLVAYSLEYSEYPRVHCGLTL